MKVLETDRLILRQLNSADAEFIFTLVNDPAWLRYIGDRGVRTLADAVDYIIFCRDRLKAMNATASDCI